MSIFIAIIINILIVVLVLGILIFVHELGHFLLSKLNGVMVEEFSIGMGPKIFSRKKGETEYSLRAFPIGGYVSILGEVETDDPKQQKMAKESPRSFLNKKWWQKMAILFAGVFFNFLLASIIYYAMLIPTGNVASITDSVANDGLWFGDVEKVIFEDYITYDAVVNEGNAVKANWPDKGIIYSVNGERLFASDELIKVAQGNKGNSVDVEICNIENVNECSTYPTLVSNEGYLGIYVNSNYVYEVHYTGVEGVLSGFAHSLNTIQISINGVMDIFNKADQTGDYSEAVNTFGGPVALYFIVDYVKDLGFVGVVGLIANLSLTLAVMNLLPIPALDGGRIVLVLVREILGDRFSHKLEAILVGGSYALLMLFMLVIVIKDVFYINDFKELIDSLR